MQSGRSRRFPPFYPSRVFLLLLSRELTPTSTSQYRSNSVQMAPPVYQFENSAASAYLFDPHDPRYYECCCCAKLHVSVSNIFEARFLAHKFWLQLRKQNIANEIMQGMKNWCKKCVVLLVISTVKVTFQAVAKAVAIICIVSNVLVIWGAILWVLVFPYFASLSFTKAWWCMNEQ